MSEVPSLKEEVVEISSPIESFTISFTYILTFVLTVSLLVIFAFFNDNL